MRRWFRPWTARPVSAVLELDSLNELQLTTPTLLLKYLEHLEGLPEEERDRGVEEIEYSFGAMSAFLKRYKFVDANHGKMDFAHARKFLRNRTRLRVDLTEEQVDMLIDLIDVVRDLEGFVACEAGSGRRAILRLIERRT